VDPVQNPYRPGAGRRPRALVGRDGEIRHFEMAIERFEAGNDDRSQILYGLRGVGKTVLLREFSRKASERGWPCHEIEAGAGLDFPREIANLVRDALLAFSTREKLSDLARRGLSALRSFQLRYRIPEGPEVSLGVDPTLGVADFGSLDRDITDLLLAVGRAAKQRRRGVLFTVDEFQFLPLDEMRFFLVALHRISQEGLPVLFVGAGLPSLPGRLGEARSYAERLFAFGRINSLDRAEAALALRQPAEELGVHWSEEALEEVARETHGYPYFLQTFGAQCWDAATGDSRIGLDDVKAAAQSAPGALDDGFFQARLDRATPAGRRYLEAMASLGPGPHLSREIATRLERRANQVSPQRDSLIRLGLIYAPRHGEVAFTVPLFDEFLRRAGGQ